MILQGKVILLTGVTNEKSIAWGIAKSLHKQGAKLVFTYRREKSMRKIQKLTNDHKINPICLVHCDVLSDDSLTEAFQIIKQNVDRIDGVVHSIAFGDIEDFQNSYHETSRDGFLLVHNVSSFSLIALSKQAKLMMSDGGSIVTQTYQGSERVIKNYNVMGAAKASLEASVRYLAEDLGKYSIRVNAISAGPILTSASIAVPGIDEKINTIRHKTPLRRNVTQGEVGDATMFLLSDYARAITGEIVHVDCGMHIIGD